MSVFHEKVNENRFAEIGITIDEIGRDNVLRGTGRMGLTTFEVGLLAARIIREAASVLYRGADDYGVCTTAMQLASLAREQAELCGETVETHGPGVLGRYDDAVTTALSRIDREACRGGRSRKAGSAR